LNRYTKVIGLRGHYFLKEFDKSKKNKLQIRKVADFTVKKFFLEGKCEVLVYFEETEKEVLVTPDSSPELIKQYLGEDFL